MSSSLDTRLLHLLFVNEKLLAESFFTRGEKGQERNGRRGGGRGEDGKTEQEVVGKTEMEVEREVNRK